MLYIHIEEEKNFAGRFCAALLTLVILRALKCILRERVEEKLNALRKSENIFSHTRTALTAPDFPKHHWSEKCFQHILNSTKVYTTQTHT